LLAALNAATDFAGPNAHKPPQGPDAFIHQEITKLAALYSDGFSSNAPKYRHIVHGQLLGTGRKDAVAFFALAGIGLSNTHYEYIAIFAKGQGRDFSEDNGPKERPYHLVTTALVGSRWSRTLDWKTAQISKGKIVVQGTRWGEDDAGCCPTQPIAVTFTLPADWDATVSPTRYPVLSENERPGQPAVNKEARPTDKEKSP
jgi:hypothetical protein